MGWIGTDKELPCDGEYCLIYVPCAGIFLATFIKHENIFEIKNHRIYYITEIKYWMRIPVLPKED